MDGVKCYFTIVREIEAWNAVQGKPDPYLVLFGLLLTERDREIFRALRIQPEGS